MDYTYRCLVPPAVRKRLEFIETTGSGGMRAFLEAISRPGQWFHVRVNTLKITPDNLLQRLRQNHPGLQIEQDSILPEALRFRVEGPASIEPVQKRVLVDKYGAEGMLSSAPIFGPNYRGSPDVFATGDIVAVHHEFRAPWDGRKYGYFCGNGKAIHGSKDVGRSKAGVVVEPSLTWFSIPRIQQWQEFQDGLLVDQHYPSMVAARVLDPQPSDAVLDACAGPGGKTTHLAQLMQDKGRIKAVERGEANIRILHHRLPVLGISCVDPVNAPIEEARPLVGPFKPSKILVDPPCSGLGTRPRLYEDKTAVMLDGFPRNQLRIIRYALGYMQPGTRMVYSTCTVAVEENEQVVARLVAENRMKIIDPGIKVGSSGVPVDTLSKNETNRFIRFFPHVHDHGGFFIAKLVRD